INDLVYIEGTGYKTLDFRTQNNLGANPFDAPGLIDGAAPYFRVAVEPHWGRHSLEFGTFGLLARVAPWLTSINTSTASMTDKYTDIGVDSQYQYQGDNYWLTLRGSYIHETQRLDASFFLGNAANLRNDLNTFTADASLAYGADNRIIATAQYLRPGVVSVRSFSPAAWGRAFQTATASFSSSPICRSGSRTLLSGPG